MISERHRSPDGPPRKPSRGVKGLAWAPFAVGIALLVLLGGCAKRKPRVPVTAKPPLGAVEAGVASWYGNPYHGRYAANGEVYDMDKLTAAHRTLPFGTWVRVRNMVNGKTVEVRITDRGPFIDGRIIDLSRAAARQIDMIGPGIVKVRVEVIATPAGAAIETYAVQAGVFRNQGNATRLRDRLRRTYGYAESVRRDGNPPTWRVLAGREATYEGAASLAERIRKEHGPAFVVRLDEPLR
ncbi:MAG: septal ring lytic transglycosylase RlpA family protein [Bryobacteraceae bacterium]|nr:septal ring lytic transglycosylase RlpA family protein [Bryobacteraceae bacterium]